MGRECELCGRPAKRRFTEVVGAKRQTMHICLDCAEKLGVTTDAPESGSAKAEIKITAQFKHPIRPSHMPTSPRRCQSCGTTLVAVRKTGRVGCADCYRAFRDHLEPLLKRVHGSLEHKGLRHESLGPQSASRHGLEHLRGELEKAIEAEDFEGAARLRDEIEQQRGAPREGGST